MDVPILIPELVPFTFACQGSLSCVYCRQLLSRQSVAISSPRSRPRPSHRRSTHSDPSWLKPRAGIDSPRRASLHYNSRARHPRLAMANPLRPSPTPPSPALARARLSILSFIRGWRVILQNVQTNSCCATPLTLGRPTGHHHHHHHDQSRSRKMIFSFCLRLLAPKADRNM